MSTPENPGLLSPRNRTIRGPPHLQRYTYVARAVVRMRRLIRTSPEFLVPCILKQAESVASELCQSEDSWSKKNLSFLQPRKLGDFSGPRFFVLITYRWFDFLTSAPNTQNESASKSSYAAQVRIYFIFERFGNGNEFRLGENEVATKAAIQQEWK